MTILKFKKLMGTAFVAAVAVGCAGGGSSPTTPDAPAPQSPAPTSNALVVPGTYNMDKVRTCVNGSGCSTRELPTALFKISSTGVFQNQMRGYVRFDAGGTFYYESIQRTDSPLGNGPEQTLFGGGTFEVSGALISFKATPGTVAPGTMTLNTDGTLARFYNIPIEPPFEPMTIQVAETYELIRE